MRAGKLGSLRGVASVVMGASLAAFAVDAFAVEEIIVTTRKRAENLQVVPVAVQALTAETLERKGIVSLQGVTQQSSSLILDQGFSPQDTRIVVRGLSPTRGRQNVAVLVDDIDVSSEAVGTAGGSLLINPRLFDLERVEIVKGPQNALYGRSAFAGAINYITKKPGDELEGRVGSDIGSNGQIEFSGALSGPLSDNVSAGITGMTWSHDGYYKNAITGGKMGDQEGTSVAGTIVWDVSDSFTATARVENLDDEFGVTPYAVVDFNTLFPVIPGAPPVNYDPDGPFGPTPPAPVGFIPGVSGDVPDADQLVAKMSEDPRTCVDPTVPAISQGGCSDYAGTSRDITRATLTLDWDVGPVTLKSLTHYADTQVDQDEGAEDVSATEASAAGEVHFYNSTDLFSQELRVLSKDDGPVTWALGALYWQERTDVRDGSATCLNYTGFPFTEPCGPFLAEIGSSVPLNADRWFRDTDHWSVYALVEWEFIPSWTLTLEGRQTWEDLDIGGPDQDNGIFDPSGTLCTFFGAPPCPQNGPGTAWDPPGPTTGPDPQVTTVAGINSGGVDDDFFAPKATLSWAAADNQLYYFSWAEAYKPKGIQAFNAGIGAFDPDARAFDQEKLQVWELGAKTDWMDNRLRVNGAVFFQDFKNKQVSTQRVEGFFITALTVNAGEAEVWGTELDLSWLATDNLTLGLSATWLDTEFTEFTEEFANAVTAAYVGNCTPVAGPTGTRCNVDYSGNELEDAPEWSLVGNARYQRPLVGSTDWFLEGDFQYQDERFDSDKNNLTYPSYWLANFRLGVMNDEWDVIAYVDNAFDDDTVKTGFEDGDIPTFQTGIPGSFPAGQFLFHGTVILPAERQFGMRVNYRFGG